MACILPLALSIWAGMAGGGSCAAQVSILTANGGNDRTNANLLETVLRPATVTPATFGKIMTLPVDGQVYAQVLYVSAAPSLARERRDEVIVCTMHNSVYAFDADPAAGGRTLWHVNLGPSVPSSIDIDPEVGILSTGVIDLQRQVVYVVAKTLHNGVPVFSLHALDLTSGAERMNGPVTISATVADTPTDETDGQRVSLDANQLLQRPGLLLANGSVYIAFGSHADLPPWHGWIVSYDASNLTVQTGVFTTTPAGEGGAVWQSGRGLAANEAGEVYALSGNGDYDGVRNFGESILKIPGTLSTPTDWFTPAIWQALSDGDVDLSAGPALISGTDIVIGADKGGDLYEVDGNSMGHLSAGNTYQVGAGYIFNFAVWSKPDGAIVYLHPKGGPLESYAISRGQLTPAPVSSTKLDTVTARVGMTLSANGSDNTSGILWENTAGRDGSGTLHAFDASNLTEIWNSDMNASRDALGAFPKFVSPTVVNGRVYAPTFSNAVAVYGLLSQMPRLRSLSTEGCERSAGSLESGVAGSLASDDNRHCALRAGNGGNSE